MTFLATTLTFAQDKVEDSAELKQNSQILAVTTDTNLPSQVVFFDLNQQLSFVVESSGKISTSFPINAGRVVVKDRKKMDSRPPTGLFELSSDPKKPGSLKATRLMTANNSNSGKSTITSFEISTETGENFYCQKENCLAMKSSDLQQLSTLFKGQPLLAVIGRRADWISQSQHVELREKLTKWLDQWKTAWQNKDLAAYMNFYSKDFSNPDFNWKQWKTYKGGLFEKYKEINVNLGSPTILRLEKTYFVRFSQDYNSNLYSDRGTKSIVILENDKGFEITSEDWSRSKQPETP
jgi:hypothetical protein